MSRSILLWVHITFDTEYLWIIERNYTPNAVGCTYRIPHMWRSIPLVDITFVAYQTQIPSFITFIRRRKHPNSSTYRICHWWNTNSITYHYIRRTKQPNPSTCHILILVHVTFATYSISILPLVTCDEIQILLRIITYVTWHIDSIAYHPRQISNMDFIPYHTRIFQGRATAIRRQQLVRQHPLSLPCVLPAGLYVCIYMHMYVYIFNAYHASPAQYLQVDL